MLTFLSSVVEMYGMSQDSGGTCHVCFECAQPCFVPAVLSHFDSKNHEQRSNITLLQACAQFGNVDAAQYLVSRGYDLQRRDSVRCVDVFRSSALPSPCFAVNALVTTLQNGFNIFMEACGYGQLAFAQWLLTQGPREAWFIRTAVCRARVQRPPACLL